MGMMLGPASALGLQPPVELGKAGEPEPRLEEAASDCLDLLLDPALLPSRRRRAGGRPDHVMIGHDQEAPVEHTPLPGAHGRHPRLHILVDTPPRPPPHKPERPGTRSNTHTPH